MGPVVSHGQYTKILSYIDHGINTEKLSLFYGGSPMLGDLKAKFGEGYFIPPTVFVDVPTSSKLWREEIFGPVLCIRVSLDLQQVIDFPPNNRPFLCDS
jgi:acyl-CoA reductase-like NAD-dependent aldehyde dehydrogenase